MQAFEDKKIASRASLKSWRNRRGIKIVVSIKPYTKTTNRAIALFEKKEYIGYGKTNSAALMNLFAQLNHSLQTNEEYPERG